MKSTLIILAIVIVQAVDILGSKKKKPQHKNKSLRKAYYPNRKDFTFRILLLQLMLRNLLVHILAHNGI
jgi:hypothetical protein